MPRCADTSSATKWPKSWSNVEDPAVPLERNLHGRPLAGLLWEGQFEGSSFGTWLGKSTELGMLILFIGDMDDFHQLYVDDIEVAGRKQNMNPVWKKLMKLVGSWRKTSFFDHVYLG